ncbi:MAG: hypothetical protein CMJ80_03170 [Planctomycetaceae bacterium]|nr:hypothetical protein [Planctomycetaceae bacterium]
MPVPNQLQPKHQSSRHFYRNRGEVFASDFTVRFLASVLAQWWRVLVPVTLLLLVVSTSIVLYLFRPEYRASAMLLVRHLQPYVAFRDETHVQHDPPLRFVLTQIEMLRDPRVLGAALERPEIAELPELRRRRDPIRWLGRKGLKIAPMGESEFLELAFEGPDPNAASMIVNAVVDAYMKVVSENTIVRANRIKGVLETEVAARQSHIKMLQSNIRELQAQLIAKEPSLAASRFGPTDVVIRDHPLSDAQESLGRAKVQEDMLETQVELLDHQIAEGVVLSEVLVDREVDRRPEVQAAIAAINQKRASLDQLKPALVNGEQNARYQRLEAELHQLEASLESLRAASRPRILAELQALSHLDSQKQLKDLQTKLATQRRVVRNLRGDYDRLVMDLTSSGDQSLDLRTRQRELDRRQAILDRISERKEMLDTELDAPDRIELYRAALPPTIPQQRLPWRALSIACMGSILIPFGVCVVWESSVRRVTSIDQLERESAVPVIGEISRLPVRSLQPVDDASQVNYQLGMFEESVDSLRTGLILAEHDAPIKILAVSSAVSGEGKSSVASQLAVSLARAAGMPTLLIDGDMRSPDLHRIFQIDLEPGLADVLGGYRRVSECINRSWSEHVHILPAGRLSKNPHKLLGGDRFRTLIDWTRRQYAFVVVDTPSCCFRRRVLSSYERMLMVRYVF